MIKRSEYRGNYGKNKSSNNRLIIILKIFTPFITIIAFGLISFIFIFPEFLKWLPFESLETIGSFAEKLANSVVVMLKLVFSNRIFQISILTLLVFIALIILLPYQTISDNNFYTLKKLWFPYYRKIGIVIAHSSILSSSNTYMYSTHANKIHQAFMNCLSLKLKRLSILISKNSDGVSILFPLITKGFSKKKSEEQLKNEIIFISSSVETQYNGKTKVLSYEQTKNFLFSLNQLKSKTSVDFSSNALKQFNLTDQIYNILIKNKIGDVCFIARAADKGKKEKQYSFDLVLFSKDKETESFFLNASSLKKKSIRLSKRIPRFEKLVSSKIHSKDLWDNDDIASLIHIPYNYRGGSLSLTTQSNTNGSAGMNENQATILIGNSIEENDLGDDISLNVKDLLLNIEIYGMIGRGKTRLVSSLLNQLLEQRVSTIVFDIKGEYARTFAEDHRVDIFTIGRPRPLCINIFDTLDEDDVRNTLLIIEEMMMTSNQEFTPAMKNLFENALFLTHKSQKRNLETFVENLFKVSRQVQLQSNVSYIQQTIDAVLNRLNFIFNPINFEILGTSRTTLDFSSLEDGNSIILDLSQFQRRAARPSDIFLVCNLILKMFYRYAAAKEMTNRLRYVAILEEAINIIPNFYHSESSASLITAENNFLLGRNLGIGHVTVSQLWDSVSNVVHGNSATKIVFRSSEKTELIGRALNLTDEAVSKIQRLPTQHCYVFFEDSESALQMKTLDLIEDPMSYSEYRTKILKKYGRSVYPLLYNNFIDMRTSLYQKREQPANIKSSKSKIAKRLNDNDRKLDTFLLKNEKFLDTKSQMESSYEKETLDIIASTNVIPDNLICERLCPEKNHNRDCLKYNMGAKIIKNSILNQTSLKNVVTLLNDEDKLFSWMFDIAKERNLEFDDFLVFCTIKSIIVNLASEDLLSLPDTYELLKRFSPRTQTTIF